MIYRQRRMIHLQIAQKIPNVISKSGYQKNLKILSKNLKKNLKICLKIYIFILKNEKLMSERIKVSFLAFLILKT